MSYWTDVDCIVKIDSKEPIENFTDIFGKECRWESPKEVWDDMANNPDMYLPSGNEGTLCLKTRLMTRVPSSKYPYRYKCKVFGNLRQFTSWHILIEWLESSLKKIQGDAQTCAKIHAYCDYMGEYFWSHTDYGYNDPYFYK